MHCSGRVNAAEQAMGGGDGGPRGCKLGDGPLCRQQLLPLLPACGIPGGRQSHAWSQLWPCRGYNRVGARQDMLGGRDGCLYRSDGGRSCDCNPGGGITSWERYLLLLSAGMWGWAWVGGVHCRCRRCHRTSMVGARWWGSSRM